MPSDQGIDGGRLIRLCRRAAVINGISAFLVPYSFPPSCPPASREGHSTASRAALVLVLPQRVFGIGRPFSCSSLAIAKYQAGVVKYHSRYPLGMVREGIGIHERGRMAGALVRLHVGPGTISHS